MSNSAVFASLTEEIGNVNSCAQLQDVVNRAMAQFSDQYAGINSQIAALAPIAALITAPTNPTEVITWIGNFIDGFLVPYYAPYAIYATQLTTLVADVAAFSTAVSNAASRIGSCSITIPPL